MGGVHSLVSHAGQQQFPTGDPRGPKQRFGGPQCGQQGPALRGWWHGADRRRCHGRLGPDGQQPTPVHAHLLGGLDRQLHPLLCRPERGHEGQQRHGAADPHALQPADGLHPQRHRRDGDRHGRHRLHRHGGPRHRHHLRGRIGGGPAHERQHRPGPQWRGGPRHHRPADRHGGADRGRDLRSGHLPWHRPRAADRRLRHRDLCGSGVCRLLHHAPHL